MDILRSHIDILSFSISDAIVSQVLDELGLQLTDQLSGNSLQKDPSCHIHWMDEQCCSFFYSGMTECNLKRMLVAYVNRAGDMWNGKLHFYKSIHGFTLSSLEICSFAFKTDVFY